MELAWQADNCQGCQQGLNPETLRNPKQLDITEGGTDICADLCHISWCFKHKETGDCQQGKELDKGFKGHGQHQTAMLFSIGNLPGAKDHRQNGQYTGQKQHPIGGVGNSGRWFQNDCGTQGNGA